MFLQQNGIEREGKVLKLKKNIAFGYDSRRISYFNEAYLLNKPKFVTVGNLKPMY